MLNGDGYWSADVVKADTTRGAKKGPAAAAKKGPAGGATGTPKGIKVGGRRNKNNKAKLPKDPALLKAQQKARAVRNARGGGAQVRVFPLCREKQGTKNDDMIGMIRVCFCLDLWTKAHQCIPEEQKEESFLDCLQ
jgi:hypothetical protein